MTTSAVTGPLVPGVHALGNPSTGQGVGDVTCATNLSFDHPRPNGPQPHFRDTFDLHSFNRPIAQSAAARICGELVSREPWTSLR